MLCLGYSGSTQEGTLGLNEVSSPRMSLLASNSQSPENLHAKEVV